MMPCCRRCRCRCRCGGLFSASFLALFATASTVATIAVVPGSTRVDNSRFDRAHRDRLVLLRLGGGWDDVAAPLLISASTCKYRLPLSDRAAACALFSSSCAAGWIPSLTALDLLALSFVFVCERSVLLFAVDVLVGVHHESENQDQR